MKQITITIRFEGKETLSLRLRGGLFRKVSLDVNGKFTKFYSLTKITNRIRKLLVEYFEN